MDKKFLLKLAYKNLMTRKLRTLLTLTGVMIGISAIVFLVAFAFGLERLITREVTGGNAFQLIDVGTGNSQIVKLNNATIGEIKNIKYIKNVEPAISAGAKVTKGNAEVDATILGATGKYLEWSGIKTRWGRIYDSAESDSSETVILKDAVVNTACIKFLGGGDPENYIGREVSTNIVIPKEFTGGDEDKTAQNQNFLISGVIKDDSSVKIYTHYKNLTDLGITDFSQVKVELIRTTDAKLARANLENMGLKTQYVGDTVAQIEQIFNVFKVILASFGLVALVVAALGMFNTMTISLLERIKEVALMKILGMSKKDVNRLFLTEAIIIGLSGGILGMLAGVMFGLVANKILNYFAVKAGGDPISVFYFSPLFMAGVFIFSALVGLVTGIYPAKRAAKVNPLDVLRYE